MSNPHKSEKNAGKRTYTKTAVTILLMIGVMGGVAPYALSLLDKEPVEEMGVAWVTEIVAVILGYLCKSYFETKQEAKQSLDEYKAYKAAEAETGSGEIPDPGPPEEE